MRRLASIALGLASLLVVILALQNRELAERIGELMLRMRSPHPGFYVPSAQLTTLEGEQVTVGEPGQGGRQVLFAFTTTCSYCRASLPAWESITARTRASGAAIDVYGVSLDSVEATRAYAAAHKLSFPTVRFPPGKLPSLYRAQDVPLIMVIDADGRVAYALTEGQHELTSSKTRLSALRPGYDNSIGFRGDSGCGSQPTHKHMSVYASKSSRVLRITGRVPDTLR